MNPDFSKLDGLLPAIIQDARTERVLMLGFMNEEAFQKTHAEKRVTFFSRTKDRLWTKGETSGNFLEVQSMTLDCDSDTVLIKALPTGPICHTGEDTCFTEQNESSRNFLRYLEGIIAERKTNPGEGSYTASLFEKGMPAIAQKVGEEATETVVASLAEDDESLLGESADLLYHLLVLLRERGLSLADVEKVLAQRHS
jgi:phosphoribosyl-ATP pyrophosphohydrolase/phosphoribosyl-AMP cyclohydrolase